MCNESGVFISLINNIIYWILEESLNISFKDGNLGIWNRDILRNANLNLLIFNFGSVIDCIFLFHLLSAKLCDCYI